MGWATKYIMINDGWSWLIIVMNGIYPAGMVHVASWEIPPIDGGFIYWDNHLKTDDVQLQRLILWRYFELEHTWVVNGFPRFGDTSEAMSYIHFLIGTFCTYELCVGILRETMLGSECRIWVKSVKFQFIRYPVCTRKKNVATNT